MGRDNKILVCLSACVMGFLSACGGNNGDAGSQAPPNSPGDSTEQTPTPSTDSGESQSPPPQRDAGPSPDLDEPEGQDGGSQEDISVDDTTPPDVAFQAPSDGETVSGNTNVNIQASDEASGVQRVEIAVDGSRGATLSSAPFEWTWDTTQVETGAHTLKATAWDSAGNTGTTAIEVNVERDCSNNSQLEACDEPPRVTLQSPQQGSYHKGMLQVEADVSDDQGLERVYLTIGGDRLQPTATTPIYQFQVDTSNYDEGTQTLKVVAIDTRQQFAQQTVDIIIDRTSPTLTLQSPEKDVLVDPQTVSMTLKGEDNVQLDTMKFSAKGPDGTLLSDIHSPPPRTASRSVDLSNLAGGQTVTFQGRATDMNDLQTSKRLEAAIDRPPAIQSINWTPSNPTTSSTVTVKTTVQDVRGLDRVEFHVNGSKVGTFQSASGSTYTYDWTPQASQPSTASVDVIAIDRVGQRDTTSRSIQLKCPQGTTLYSDQDGDGYGQPGTGQPFGQVAQGCQVPSGYATNDRDCDDSSDVTYPGAAAKDSTTACMKDVDQDGYGDASSPSGVQAGDDCNDANADVSPDASETCNGRDDDCDGQTDEQLTKKCANQTGVCQGSTVQCKNGSYGGCGPQQYGPNYENLEDETDRFDEFLAGKCDGLDNNCDGVVDKGCNCTYDPTEPNNIDTDNSHNQGVCQDAPQIRTKILPDGTCQRPPSYQSPEPGTPDQLDNDCDGRTDPIFEDIEVLDYGIGFCAITQSGRVACWNNPGGVFGNRKSPRKTQFIDSRLSNLSPPFEDVAIGGNFVCAVAQGDVACAVRSSYSKSKSSIYQPSSYVSSSGTIMEVDAGLYHACVLYQDGDVQCWGYGTYPGHGKEGPNYSSAQQYDSDQALAPDGGHSWTKSYQDLTLGQWGTCGLTRSGNVRCSHFSEKPQSIPSLQKISAVRITRSNKQTRGLVCGLSDGSGSKPRGTLYCWSGSGENFADPNNHHSELADNPTQYAGWMDLNGFCGINKSQRLECADDNRTRPQVLPKDTFQDIAERGQCGVKTDGRLRCWKTHMLDQFNDFPDTYVLDLTPP